MEKLNERKQNYSSQNPGELWVPYKPHNSQNSQINSLMKSDADGVSSRCKKEVGQLVN